MTFPTINIQDIDADFLFDSESSATTTTAATATATTVATVAATAATQVYQWVQHQQQPERLLQKLHQRSLGSVPNIDMNATSVFEQCSLETVPLQCISDNLESLYYGNATDANEWLLIFAAAMVFFMQAGFAMLCAGCVRVKNVGTLSP